MENTAYRDQIAAWRRHVEATLRGEHGWLALAGLYWLRDGQNTLGTGSDRHIVLPSASTPAHAGRIELRDAHTRLTLETGVTAMVGGRSVSEAELQPDTATAPTFFDLGRLRFVVVRRGERLGLRMWDPDNPDRRRFPGRIWFPVDERYRLAARFVPFDPPKPTRVVNILGDVESSTSPGRAVFELDGRELSLEVSSVDEDGLFIAFSDSTAAVSTYTSGRYLHVAGEVRDELVLDFNRAYNPPCAFTPFATCELPSPGNRLDFNIEAGERYDGSWRGAPDHDVHPG
jgi:hypothetical protein